MTVEDLARLAGQFLAAELRIRSLVQEPTAEWRYADKQYRASRDELREAVWAVQRRL